MPPSLARLRCACAPLAFVCACLLFATVAHAAPVLPDDAVDYQVDAAHTGGVKGQSPAAPLQKLWAATGNVFGTPLVVGDLVYAAIATNGVRSVKAFDRLTGDEVWSQPGGSRGIAYDDDTVFALDQGVVQGQLGGDLQALDAATGVQLWTQHLAGQPFFSSAPVAADDTVYVAGEGNAGTLFAIDGTTGEQLWTQDVGGGTQPSVDADHVYTTSGCAQTWAIDRLTAAVDWRFDSGCGGGGGSPAVVHVGRVYVRDRPGYAFELDTSSGQSLAMFDGASLPPSFGDGYVALYSSLTQLRARDETTGDVPWTYAPGAGIAALPPVQTATTAYALRGDGRLVALDLATGAELWSADPGIGLPSAPNVNAQRSLGIGSGVVAVPSDEGLAVFGEPGPDTRISDQPLRYGAGTAAHFSFDSPDAGATFDCALDGASWSACSSPLDLTALDQGVHALAVRARTASGVDGSPSTRSWLVDTVAPSSAIDSAPPALTNSTDASFTFTSDDDQASFECRVDGGAWSDCGTGVDFSAVPDGDHTLDARAWDPSGNVDPTPASAAWTVDATAPDTTIGTSPAAQSSDASATFAFSSSEPGSTFSCRLDDAAWTACTSPAKYQAPSAGSHSFAVKATDRAGNEDSTPATVNWTQKPALVRAPTPTPIPTPAGDYDGDGIANGVDRCPDKAGVAPTGCPAETKLRTVPVDAGIYLPVMRKLLSSAAHALRGSGAAKLKSGRSVTIGKIQIPTAGALTVELVKGRTVVATVTLRTGKSSPAVVRLRANAKGRRLPRSRRAPMQLRATFTTSDLSRASASRRLTL